MVVLTAETCWALNEYWINNKISGSKLVFSLLNYKDDALSHKHKIHPRTFYVFRNEISNTGIEFWGRGCSKLNKPKQLNRRCSADDNWKGFKEQTLQGVTVSPVPRTSPFLIECQFYPNKNTYRQKLTIPCPLRAGHVLLMHFFSTSENPLKLVQREKPVNLWRMCF